MLDLPHRIHEADESFKSLDFMVHTRLFLSHIVVQLLMGTLLPLTILAVMQVVRFQEKSRVRLYSLAGCMTMIGIFAMRWNVVIGGQIFSKSFLGYTTYRMGVFDKEGLLPAVILMILPFVILLVLVKLLPPWPNGEVAL
jgi:Ni/Fe-hydrogenase subunit HybB-like protein